MVKEIVFLRVMQFSSFAILGLGALACVGYEVKKKWMSRLAGFIIIILAIVILSCIAKLVGYYMKP